MQFAEVMIGGIFGVVLGVFITSLSMDGPKAPQFHEELGCGSRVTLSVNALNERYANFSYRGTDYKVKVPSMD